MSNDPTREDASRPSDESPLDDTLGETVSLRGDTSRYPSGAPSPPGLYATPEWVGRRLGKYEIRDILGAGGMGVVYRAYDTLIEREAAIKVLPQVLSAHPAALERFLAEAKAAGKLSHPHAVGIYEIGQEESSYYLVLEYLPGGSIADELETRGAFSVLEATRIIAHACQGLGAAHAVGLIHRDIKPANLLRAQDGAVKVADFGLAKFTAETTSGLTQTGQVIGTPYFMSPEQCESRPLDRRSDIYSLGGTYYALLTGANPYASATSTMQVMFAHCHSDPPDPRALNPAIPQACSQIIAKAMAKEPSNRYQTADEMLADLNAVIAALSGTAGIDLPSQSGSRRVARPLPVHSPARPRVALYGMIAMSGVLVAAIALGGWSWYHRGDRPPAAPNPAAAVPLPAPAPGGPPVRVGVLHSLSGTMAESESPVVDATLLAVDEVNQAGGVLGRPLEAVVRDGRSDPQIFAQQAELLLQNEGVPTVFGCWTSASRKTVAPIFERFERLLVYPVQYEGLEESPWVFYLGAAPNQQLIPALQWAYAFGNKRKFFLVGSDYVFPRTANAIARDTLSGLGAQVVGEEYLPLGSYQVEAIVERIRDAAPDVILNTINGDSNAPFFKALRGAGLTTDKVTTISLSIGEEELRFLDVAHMVGDFATWNYFQSIDSPENRDFVARFRQRYGPRRLLTDPMEAAYLGVKLWAAAVNQAGSLDPVAIREALRLQSTQAPEGAVRIDAATHHAYKTPRIGRITPDGQFEIIWTAAKPEPPLPFPPSRSKRDWEIFLENLYLGWNENWSAPQR